MELPTVQEYKAALESMVDQDQLTVDQAVLLLTIFRNHTSGKLTSVRQLMGVANLNWKRVNAILNGLVLRGAIKKHENHFYSL